MRARKIVTTRIRQIEAEEGLSPAERDARIDEVRTRVNALLAQRYG